MARTAKPWEELTESQKKNRLRNQRYNGKTNNVVSMSPQVKATSRPKKIDLDWVILFKRSLQPRSIMSIASVICLSSYLVLQFYLASDIYTGLIVEFLGIVFAGLSATSVNKLSRYISFAGIISVIVFSAVILHSGFNSKSANNDWGLNALKTDREMVVTQISQINSDISSLPAAYISKKETLRSKLQPLSSQLSSLNSQISSYSVSSGFDLSSLLIRVLCMIANMVLVHRLFSVIGATND